MGCHGNIRHDTMSSFAVVSIPRDWSGSKNEHAAAYYLIHFRSVFYSFLIIIQLFDDSNDSV